MSDPKQEEKSEVTFIEICLTVTALCIITGLAIITFIQH